MLEGIHFPSGIKMKNLVAYGNTGLVLRVGPPTLSSKVSPGEERLDAMAVEQQIYEHFVQRGGHQGILICHGTFGRLVGEGLHVHVLSYASRDAFAFFKFIPYARGLHVVSRSPAGRG